jgi:hypothetical protein
VRGRPFDSTAGFDTEELCTEGQVVILPARAPLTGRAHMRMADVTVLPGLLMPRWPGPDGTDPDGHGPRIRDHAGLVRPRPASSWFKRIQDMGGRSRLVGSENSGLCIVAR